MIIALDEPFLPPPPASPTERSALVRTLIDYFKQHGTVGRLGLRAEQIPRSEDTEGQRRLLRALLTIRDPQPLPEDFHRAMDALLQQERVLTPTRKSGPYSYVADRQ